MPVASRSAPATPCPTGPAQFRETAVPGRYDQSPSNVSSANPPSRIPATGLFHATGALFFRPMKPPHVASGDSRRGPGSVNFSSSKKPPSIARRSRFTVELPQPIVLRFSSRPAEGDASMEVRCDKCQARYRVDDARIGPQGLTMRCGKCQNTFRVTRPAAPAPQMSPRAPRRAATARSPDMDSTAIFAVPPASRPCAPAKPLPQSPKANAAGSAAPPAPEEAGRTMMFPAANLPGAGVAVSKGPQAGASSTAAFGQPRAPKIPPSPPSVSNPPAAGQSTVSGKRSTLVFGPSQPQARSAPAAAPMPIAAAVPTPVPTPEPPEHTTTPDLIAAGAFAAQAAPPAEQHEIADEEASPEPGTFDRAPPRGLIIGVAAGLALLLVVGAGLVAYRRLAPRAPPPAATETLASAEADAEKDSLAWIASAETKARDALEVAGLRVRFPQATATLARIEIQWADALNDQASRIGEKNAEDPRVAQLQTQAKARVKSAFDLLSPAVKANADSHDLQLALADY